MDRQMVKCVEAVMWKRGNEKIDNGLKREEIAFYKEIAERVGFEPTVPLLAGHTISSRVADFVCILQCNLLQ